MNPLTVSVVNAGPRLRTESLRAWYGRQLAIDDIDLAFGSNSVTALMGPSGCGKSTLLRCLNRIHETIPNARVEGRVVLDGEDVYESQVEATVLRCRVGMVFQRANPFPTMSIADNVLAGPRFGSRRFANGEHAEVVERSLRRAALWDEVKEKLHTSALALSGGQQQRLCIARALAVEPEILLMDEPTASLDPISTSQIEDLVAALARELTVVIVTHNLQQAARVSSTTAFMLGDEFGVGRIVEVGATDEIFTKPKDRRTEDYVTGRFG